MLHVSTLTLIKVSAWRCAATARRLDVSGMHEQLLRQQADVFSLQPSSAARSGRRRRWRGKHATRGLGVSAVQLQLLREPTKLLPVRSAQGGERCDGANVSKSAGRRRRRRWRRRWVLKCFKSMTLTVECPTAAAARRTSDSNPHIQRQC